MRTRGGSGRSARFVSPRRVSEAPRDTIVTPRRWRLTGRRGRPPPSGATPGWTARPRTLSASADAFDQRGGVLGDEPADQPPRSLTGRGANPDATRREGPTHAY